MSMDMDTSMDMDMDMQWIGDATLQWTVLWSRNFLFPLRLRLSKSFGSAPAPTLALYLPYITDFILKSGFFMFFMIEYLPNSHAGFYTMWIFIFIYYLSCPGAGAEASTFRLRLHNTGNGHTARTFICSTDMVMQHRHGHEASKWTCSFFLQGHAAST